MGVTGIVWVVDMIVVFKPAGPVALPKAGICTAWLVHQIDFSLIPEGRII